MAIEWFNPKDKLPEDTQECLLMPPDHGGLVTIAVYGPISWREKDQVWMDIFRDPAAGSIVKVEQVGLWTAWEPIAPQEASESELTEPSRASHYS